MDKRILVATIGRPGSDAALRAAAALSARSGAKVDVITVLEPLPVYDVGFAPMVLPFEEIDRTRREELLARVRAQVDVACGTAGLWDVELHIGSPYHVIAEAAAAKDVAFVVLGIGRHEPADRIFGHETALRVGRLACVPVLAVAQGSNGIPRHIVVATDFSPSSLRAAHAAAELVATPGRLTLVHVAPSVDVESAAAEEWERRYAAGVADAFARLEHQLAVPPGITVDTRVLHGDAALELLHLVGETGADAIAVGSHGYNFMERVLVGSVATKILRSARCSVLLVPPEQHARRAPGTEHALAGESRPAASTT